MPSQKRPRQSGTGSSRISEPDELFDRLLDSAEQLRTGADQLDPLGWIQTYLKIRTKDQQLVPLKLNAPQRCIYGKVKELRDQHKPVRMIILKARQEGVSTLIESLIFEATARHQNTNSVIIAHDLDGSDHLFGMSKLYYDELPDGMKPATQYSNRKELDFSEPLRSRINVDTAGNLTAGRSHTIHNFHASEVAFWGNAKEVMLGVAQAVPDHSDTMIVLESTANGLGGWFYEQWQRAKRGESDYVPIFIPWHQLGEYKRPVPEAGLGTLDEEEQRLRDAYRLTDTQLAWRRWAIRNKCGGDVDQFKQEYPSDDYEAFLFSGRPGFNPKILREYLDSAIPPQDQGILTQEGRFESQAGGYLRIWQHPESNTNYAIGVDVAEGLETGDYSCAQVLDRKTMEQVAEWHGHIDPDLFGVELDRLGRFYNTALIGVEVNNHGLTTITALKKLEYWNLYKHEVLGRDNQVASDRLGWRTDLRTKPLMIDELAQAIRERSLGMRSKELVEECLTYVVNPDGSTGAQPGCFDDRLVAMAIALQMYKKVYPPPEPGPVGPIPTALDRVYGRLGRRWRRKF